MEQDDGLTQEERDRIMEIQDLLIDRYIELKEEVQNDNKIRAREIGIKIRQLLYEKEEIESWANVCAILTMLAVGRPVGARSLAEWRDPKRRELGDALRQPLLAAPQKLRSGNAARILP